MPFAGPPVVAILICKIQLKVVMLFLRQQGAASGVPLLFSCSPYTGNYVSSAGVAVKIVVAQDLNNYWGVFNNRMFSMYISNVRQIYAAPSVQGGNVSPGFGSVEGGIQVGEPDSHSRHIDMKNISFNEINELIKSGVEGLLDIVPAIPVQVINQYGYEYAANVKIDYFSQVQGQIKFQKSTGRDTAYLERVMDNLKKLDGMKLPEKINLVV
jgi:hypothetical protein